MELINKKLAFDTCPNCGETEVARLPRGWQNSVLMGATIETVACGNPFHYIFPEEGTWVSDGPEEG